MLTKTIDIENSGVNLAGILGHAGRSRKLGGGGERYPSAPGVCQKQKLNF